MSRDRSKNNKLKKAYAGLNDAVIQDLLDIWQTDTAAEEPQAEGRIGRLVLLRLAQEDPAAFADLVSKLIMRAPALIEKLTPSKAIPASTTNVFLPGQSQPQVIEEFKNPLQALQSLPSKAVDTEFSQVETQDEEQ